MCYSLRACVFNAFNVLAPPAREWSEVHWWSEAVWTKRAVFSLVSCSTPLLYLHRHNFSCLYVGMSDCQHSSTELLYHVTIGGTQPMHSVCCSVSQPQILSSNPLSLTADSSSQVLVVHLHCHGRIQLSPMLPTTSYQIVAETLYTVIAWSTRDWQSH